MADAGAFIRGLLQADGIQVKDRYEEEGCTLYLRMPVNPENLYRAVHRYLLHRLFDAGPGAEPGGAGVEVVGQARAAEMLEHQDALRRVLLVDARDDDLVVAGEGSREGGRVGRLGAVVELGADGTR